MVTDFFISMPKPSLNYAYRSHLYIKSVHFTKAIMVYFNLHPRPYSSFPQTWNTGLKSKYIQYLVVPPKCAPSLLYTNKFTFMWLLYWEPFQCGNYWKFYWGLILSLSCLLLNFFFLKVQIEFVHSLVYRLFWVQVSVFTSLSQSHEVHHP